MIFLLFLKGWLIGAGVLLLTYIISCLIIDKLNKRPSFQLKKLQVLSPPKWLIKRDIIQSLHRAVVGGVYTGAAFTVSTLNLGVHSEPYIMINIFCFLASIIMRDTWFYWVHRLMHRRSIFKKVHAFHHVAVAPAPWSNQSETFYETFLTSTYWIFMALVLPMSPYLVFIHSCWDEIQGCFGHSGYEYSANKLSHFFAPVLFHDQHHRFKYCNYGNAFTVWDRLMNTLHPEFDSRLDSLIKNKHQPY